MNVTITSTRNDTSRMANAGVDTGTNMLGVAGAGVAAVTFMPYRCGARGRRDGPSRLASWSDATGGASLCGGRLERRHEIGQSLPQKQPRAMHTRFHDSGVEPQHVGDLAIRSPFDVTKHEHDAVRGGQLVDRRGQGRAQLDLDGWVVHARRPVGGGG